MEKKILVVDNDININGLIKSVLETKKGYTVDFVLGGKEGLKKMKTDHYDLVLLDLTMPEVSGIDVCKFMSHDEDLVKIPVIIVSAMPINSKEFQKENDDFQSLPVVKGLIEKPFEVADLLKEVEKVLA